MASPAYKTRFSLALAAMFQLGAGVYLALKVLDFLRRDHSGWEWVLITFLIFALGPFAIWAAMRVLSSFALGRGDRAEWWRSMTMWSLLLLGGALGLVTGHPAWWLVLPGATMLTLLLAARPALRAN